jgi:uncharacterized phiE125 gp8 family phage protein
MFPQAVIRTNYPYTVQSVVGSNDDIITLAEIKEWLRLESTDTSEDTTLTLLRDGVIKFAEDYTHLTFLQTTFKTTRDQFANHLWIELRKSPYVSLTSFEYLVSTVLTTVSASVFYAELTSDYTNLRLSDGQTWPTNEDRRLAAIEIVFVAGLGGASIPSGLKIGMLNHIASWYEKRGDCDTCTCEDALPSATKQTYNEFKIMHYGKPSNERGQLPGRLI